MNITTFSLMVVSTICFAQEENQPSYEEVVHHYFQRYSHPDWYAGIHISRRPSGYVVEKRIGLETDTAE